MKTISYSEMLKMLNAQDLMSKKDKELVSLREQLAQAEKQVASAAYLMRECDNYLQTNQYTNIGHNSILHIKLWQMANELDDKS
ncbi:hypothetical protein BAE46_01050 [Glaciecola punicea]|uniref:hypothetical protein n=1 Tax=Glaciecola punicea TaxID=56804 RepID=UPI000871BEAA|nr:hypothetical protein [Glaciecola punicea]OFA33330.1 hypothetical protein BAE46_01050 [Glaciecola punicea]